MLWGVNDHWTGEDYAHPARTRLTCLEVAGLIFLILIGWAGALWFDSALREARALRPAVEQGK